MIIMSCSKVDYTNGGPIFSQLEKENNLHFKIERDKINGMIKVID